MILTKKIQLYSDNQEFWNFLYKLDKTTFRMCNIAMQQLYMNDAFEQALTPKIEYTKENAAEIKKYRKEVSDKMYKEILQTSKQNTGYKVLADEFGDISSYVRSAISNMVWKHYNADFKKVKTGEATQRTYKKGCPTPITKTAFRNITDDNFDLFDSKVKFVFGRDKSKNLDVIKKIVSGEYKMSDSSLFLDGKKAFLLLCVDLPEKSYALNDDINCELDISFKYPIIFTNKNTGQIKEIGDSNKLLLLRQQLNKRFENSQSKLQFTSGGHGRTNKLQALNYFEKLEKNIAKTLNHQVTKHCINEVIRAGAKNITVLIDKSKFVDETEMVKKFVHRFWGYHEIKSKLEYKCKMHNINVTFKDI